jgi:hypothetical protein
LGNKDLLAKYQFEQEKGDARFLDEPDLEFPKPMKRFRIIVESSGASIEEPYFWILNMFREGMQFVDIIKLKDIFTATETSSFFGLTANRLQQEQALAGNYMQNIGAFIPQLTTMINEIKKIDTRLSMYYEGTRSFRPKTDPDYDRPESNSAEVALRQTWAELIDAGAGRNPSSLFNLAHEMGFATLPNLFFASDAKSTKDVDKAIDPMLFNDKVKNVLKAKLYSYFAWKENTFIEYTARRSFLIKYLRQHYEIIRTYLNWLRPYLLHAKRMSADEHRLNSPDLIGAFEQSMVEVEFLAKKKGKKYNKCILAHFLFKTRPSLEFVRMEDRGQQRGAVHIGRVEITLRGYSWTDEQLDAFKKLREDQDIDLLGFFISSDQTLNLLREDLKKYLKEAGGEMFKEDVVKKEEKKVESKPFDLFEPFREFASASLEPIRMMGRGFAELAGHPVTASGTKVGKPPSAEQIEAESAELKSAKKEIVKNMFLIYNIFKKAHLMPGF